MRKALALLLVAACGDNDPEVVPVEEPQPEPVAATCNEATIADTLRALPNVTAVTPSNCGSYVVGSPRCFHIDYQQPIQHANAAGPKLTQKLWLVHRSCDRPTLVGDNGYSHEFFYDDELSVLYRTNMLWIEHRYQGKSTPAPGEWDWTALTIENGAADMHAIITSFRQHYGGRF